MQPRDWRRDPRYGARSVTDSVMRGHFLLVSSHDALQRSGITVVRPGGAARDAALEPAAGRSSRETVAALPGT